MEKGEECRFKMFLAVSLSVCFFLFFFVSYSNVELMLLYHESKAIPAPSL